MSVKKYDTDEVSLDQYKEADFCKTHDIFESHKFVSSGISGSFELRIFIFKEKRSKHFHLYELGFGTWDSNTMNIDDLFQTKNGDADKILATVAVKAVEFIENHPNTLIFAAGSTDTRTRLYQRQIAENLDNVPKSLRIQGISYENDDGWSDFQKGINYDAFLLSSR